LRVTLLQQDGSPVKDETEVVLTASLGQLEQRRVRTRGGVGSVKYQAGTQVGMDRIEAASGSLKSELALAIGSAPLSRVLLTADPVTLPVSGGQAELTATALSPSGEGVAGVPIRFTTSAGSVSPAEPVTTDAGGKARAKLTTSAPATVRAVGVDSRSDEIAIRLRTPIDLSVAASLGEADVGQNVVFTVHASVGGQPVAGALRVDFGDGAGQGRKSASRSG
jgi:hypothetical protein